MRRSNRTTECGGEFLPFSDIGPFHNDRVIELRAGSDVAVTAHRTLLDGSLLGNHRALSNDTLLLDQITRNGSPQTAAAGCGNHQWNFPVTEYLHQ
jgi:hypothetical protein